MVIFPPGCVAIGLGYTDIDMSIASMRTHLHKYILAKGQPGDVDPDTCVVCMEAPKDVQCCHCYASSCRACFVKTMLSKPEIGSGVYECPGCRRESHMLDTLDSLQGGTEYCCPRANQAILLAMKSLDVVETCLTIVVTEPEVRLHALNVDCDADFTNLRKKTGHSKTVNKLLAARGTRFLVGEPPVKCPCCDVLNHGNLLTGLAFEVTGKGVWSLDDEFGTMMVFVAYLRSESCPM